MPATYEPIASTTLGSAAASISLSNIPGTFTDLVLIGFFRGEQGSPYKTDLRLQFNSDTGNNYSDTRLYYSPGSGRSTNANRIFVGGSNDGIDTAANTFSPLILHIMCYANTNVYKTTLSRFGKTEAGLEINVGLWRSTSAITSLTFAANNSANFQSGCSVSLYGIKAA